MQTQQTGQLVPKHGDLAVRIADDLVEVIVEDVILICKVLGHMTLIKTITCQLECESNVVA